MYQESDVVPQLVLIATPGYAIYTVNSFACFSSVFFFYLLLNYLIGLLLSWIQLEETKQIPRPSNTETKAGLSGYNNEYPEMLGLFLARGPSKCY